MNSARDKRILEALQRKARESHSAAERAAFGRKAAEVEARLQAAGVGIQCKPDSKSTTEWEWQPPKPDRAPPRNDGHRHGKPPPDPDHEPSVVEDLVALAAGLLQHQWGLISLALSATKRAFRMIPFMVWPCTLVLFAEPIGELMGVPVVPLIVFIAGFGIVAGTARKRLEERGLAD